MTDRRVIVVSSSRLRDVGLRHIMSIEVNQKYDELLAGFLLVTFGFFVMMLIIFFLSDVVLGISLEMLLILSGIPLIIYGYFNMYSLKISWYGGSIEIRDGKEKLVNLHLKIGEQIEKVKLERE